jgi:cobalt/nickel transport system ATP-binding protein
LIFDVHDAVFSYLDAPPSLNQTNLRICRGDHLALIGANGAGKSTLLQLLGALIYATSGSVNFEGTQLTHISVDHDPGFRRMFRSRVGYLFQNSDAQLFCATVREEVAFGPLQIFPSEEALEYTCEAMRKLDIDRLANEAPYALSGGEKRRVALASVISMQPEILLLDEPTANLDPKTCDTLFALLQEFGADPRRTIVTATHDLNAAREIANTCAVLTTDHKVAVHGNLLQILADDDLLRQVNLVSDRQSRENSAGFGYPWSAI